MKYTPRLVASLFFYIFVSLAFSAENPELEKLLNLARTSGKSSDCLNVCSYMAENGIVSELFAQYAQEGYRAALRERNAESIALYYDCKAEYGMLLGEMDSYMKDKRKALSIYEKLGNKPLQANCHIYIGNYFNAIGQYDSARIYLTRMQPYAKQHYKESSYNIMLTCLADAYYRMGEKDSAIHYEKLSAQVSRVMCDIFYTFSSYRSLGIYYRTSGQMDSALAYYEKALDLSLSRDTGNSSEMEELTSLYISLAVLCNDTNRAEEAHNYLLLAVKSIGSVNNEIFLAQAFSNIGSLFLKGKNYGEAMKYIKRGVDLSGKLGMNESYLRGISYYIKIHEELGNLDSIPPYIAQAEKKIPSVQATLAKVSYYQAVVGYLIKNKDYSGALRVSEKILALPGVQDSKFVMQELYGNMRLCYYRLGNYKAAYESLDKAVALRDSTYYGEKSKELQELAVKYRTKEKELEIVQLNAQKEKSEEQARVRIIILVSCLAVSSLVFLFIVQRQKMKSERLKRAAEQREREFAVLKQETELRLARKYIEGLETERGRLAKELHDGVSNNLLSLEVKLKPLLAAADASIFSFLSQTREDVRNISHELMPPAFQYATIDEMLDDYVNHLVVPASLKLCYYSDPSGVDWSIIPENIGYEIYRIVQEALNNSLKHASATSASASLELDADTLIVRITDNGKGFDTEAKYRGIGMQTMRERAAVIGGEFLIESGETGTKIKLVVPITPVDKRK